MDFLVLILEYSFLPLTNKIFTLRTIYDPLHSIRTYGGAFTFCFWVCTQIVRIRETILTELSYINITDFPFLSASRKSYRSYCFRKSSLSLHPLLSMHSPSGFFAEITQPPAWKKVKFNLVRLFHCREAPKLFEGFFIRRSHTPNYPDRPAEGLGYTFLLRRYNEWMNFCSSDRWIFSHWRYIYDSYASNLENLYILYLSVQLWFYFGFFSAQLGRK